MGQTGSDRRKNTSMEFVFHSHPSFSNLSICLSLKILSVTHLCHIFGKGSFFLIFCLNRNGEENPASFPVQYDVKYFTFSMMALSVVPLVCIFDFLRINKNKVKKKKKQFDKNNLNPKTYQLFLELSTASQPFSVVELLLNSCDKFFSEFNCTCTFPQCRVHFDLFVGLF